MTMKSFDANMQPSLSQLDREAMLLMYLAGELPDNERIAVEQRLAADAGLTLQLQQLVEAQQRVHGAIEQLDHHDRLPTSEGVASRRVMRAMHQWQVDRII